MKNCLLLRHVAFEDLGTLAAILTRCGMAPRYLNMGVDPIDPAEVARTDLLVVLIGHTVKLGKANIPAATLRKEIAEFGGELQRHGGQVFNEWLDGVTS